MKRPHMEEQYLQLLKDVMLYGEERKDRTGTGTISLFGSQIECDLGLGFPLLTTKKLHWKSIVHELLWMISGSTNVRPLQEAGVRIWDEWADADGELGPVYGKQWRSWSGIGSRQVPGRVVDHVNRYTRVDQLRELVDGIRKDPTGRRHIVTAWNPVDIPLMKLPPCHMMFQCYVSHGRYLSLKMYQRSADLFLGVPFNIASYALLTHMLARTLDLAPGRLFVSFGDAHVYLNHKDQVQEQLSREVRYPPRLMCTNGFSPMEIDKFKFDDFVLDGYDPHPAIKAPVSV